MPSISLAPPTYNFLFDPIWIGIETSNKSAAPGGGFEWTLPNLSLLVEVWYVNEDGVGRLITNLETTYNPATGDTKIDLSRLLPLDIAPPPDSVIGSASVEYGRILGMYGAIYLKLREAYGIPKELSGTTQTTADFYIVYGSSRYHNGPDKGPANILLHSYYSFRRKQTRNVFYKEVTRDQPEIICIWSKAGGSISLNKTVRKTGNVLEAGTVPVTLQKGVNYIAASPTQLGITGTDVIGYTIGLGSFSPYQGINYVLRQNEPDDQLFLLMDNGCGGLETIRVSGNKSFDVDVEFEKFERPRIPGDDFRKGNVDTTIKRGADRIQCNTGYYSRDYIEHIRQLAMGKVWLIDMVRKKYNRYIVTSGSIKVSESQADLFAFDFTIEQAWRSHSFSSFNN